MQEKSLLLTKMQTKLTEVNSQKAENQQDSNMENKQEQRLMDEEHKKNKRTSKEDKT